MSKLNLSTRLIKAHTGLSTSLQSKEFLSVLTGFNFGEERIRGGYKTYEEAKYLVEAKEKQYNEQLEATRQFNIALDLAMERYSFAVSLARVAFKNDPKAADILGLSGSPKKSFASWLERAEPFYNNLLTTEELLSEIEKYGLTKEILTTNQQAMQDLLNLNDRFAKEKGEAMEATRVRNEKIAELDSFMSDFKKICKLAFADRPEVLVQLGMGK